MEDSRTPEFRQYLGVVRRWLWLIVVGTVLAAATAFGVSWLSTPLYEASTTLLISEGQKATAPDYNAILTSERLAKTYSQLLKSKPILDEVGNRLGLWLGCSEVSVELVRDTQLIRLRVRDPDRNVAARIADTIPQVFIEQNERIQSARFANSKQSLSREMEALQAEIDSTQRAMDAERVQEERGSSELARLEALLAQYRSTYASLLRSYEELRVAEARVVDTVTVVEPAEVPARPVLPRTATNTVLAALVGGLLAVGAAFLIEYLDDTLKTADDVEQAAHLPTLAAVMHFERFGANGQGPVMAAHPQSAIAEGYRVLRTNLQFTTIGMGHSAVTLLVTSAQPLEGKTTTLANLGISLAQIGKKVLLVDADLRRPALHTHFGLENRVGLTSLLLEHRAPPWAVQESGIPRLSVLTAGPIPANPAEVLEFAQTSALLNQLKPLAEYVLLDSPPVLSVADASILAQKVDGVVLVAEMGRTRTDVFRRAVGALERVKARMVGVVLNKVSPRHGGYYDDYHYYHYYYSDEAGAGGRRRGRRKSRLGRAIGWLVGASQDETGEGRSNGETAWGSRD